MGYMKHHAIIVTGSTFGGPVEAARAIAIMQFKDICPVSEISNSPMNEFRSFAVFSDGSKEGWDESNEGDVARDRFTALLLGLNVDWVELSYADDHGPPQIIRSSSNPVKENE